MFSSLNNDNHSPKEFKNSRLDKQCLKIYSVKKKFKRFKMA